MKTYSFYKELTAAEVGDTGTHEIYIRFPNNFDYETFFHDSAVENGTVIEVSFEAQDLTDNVNSKVNLRFVYYVNNTNKEKRIPGLSNLFREHQIKQGDIVCLESRIEDDEVSYYLHFYRKGEIEINPSSVFISRNEDASFHNFSRKFPKELPLQQIYYGAPGTGKSHIINEQVRNESVIRTTFHPDSDYSTFVGCYKPTMKNSIAEVISMTELKKKLFDFKLKGDAYPCQRFAAQYWNSLINLSAKDIKEILSDCGFTEAFNVEIAKGISVGKEMSTNTEDRIVYEFVDQAFLKAYIQAWKYHSVSNEEIKKQYLVIEEINRGNCAQIFGDLFQLLDRNSYGFSDYPIHADNDMKKQLSKAFKDLNISDESKARINAYYKGNKDYVKQVLEGEILLLPDNFYIWATMNTSDQSLFPIDSAFKRRWDWQYMPISKGRENGKDMNWSIVANNNEYDWWSFLTKINEQIGSTTNSEDKKLGFFFCKALNGKISTETFVGKVIFYLWNDVFKDFGFDNAIFNDEDGSTLSFDKFYSTENGKVIVCKDKVEKFLKNLGVDVFKEIDFEPEETLEPEEQNELDELSEDTEHSELERTRYRYWGDFLKYINQTVYKNIFNTEKRNPVYKKFYDFGIGSSETNLYIGYDEDVTVVGYWVKSKSLYDKFVSYKSVIEQSCGELKWIEINKACKIIKEFSFRGKSQEEQFKLMLDEIVRMRELFIKYVK